jgi:clan AA aspartic protease
MITGRVTSNRDAVVPLQLQAADGSPETVDAVVDTGFTEFVALPADRIAGLGLPLAGLQRIFLADGSATVLMAYEAVVHWHGEDLAVEALEVDAGALIGMALLEGSRLTIDVARGGSVQIEPMVRR